MEMLVKKTGAWNKLAVRGQNSFFCKMNGTWYLNSTYLAQECTLFENSVHEYLILEDRKWCPRVRKCWISLGDSSDVMRSLRWLDTTSLPGLYFLCKTGLSSVVLGGDPDSVVGTQKAPCSSQCREKAAQKGLQGDFTLQSDQLCFGIILSGLSNRIYLGIKTEVLKQLIS